MRRESPYILMAQSIFILTALSLLGCSSDDVVESSKVIVVPSTATSSPPYRGDGSPPPRRYVVRMSDGERDWEVEFPDNASGYELRIPLDDPARDGVVVEGKDLTDADRELLDALRRRNGGMQREGIYEDGQNLADPEGQNQLGGLTPGAELPGSGADVAGTPTQDIDPWAGTEGEAQPARRSYFLGIEDVKKLYRSGRYEVAIVYLKELERDYPNDPKLLSMMGTLYLKLGQEDLARTYWERVLQVDPTDRTVIEALKQLNSRSVPDTLSRD